MRLKKSIIKKLDREIESLKNLSVTDIDNFLCKWDRLLSADQKVEIVEIRERTREEGKLLMNKLLNNPLYKKAYNISVKAKLKNKNLIEKARMLEGGCLAVTALELGLKIINQEHKQKAIAKARMVEFKRRKDQV